MKSIESDMEKLLKQLEKLISQKKYNSVNDILHEIDSREEKFIKNYLNRKQEGVYYTDLNLSYFIFQKTLKLYLNKKLRLKLREISDIYNLDENIKIKIDNTLKILTICDPTCGSGNFLINAAEILFSILNKINPERDHVKIKTQILRNLYGFDINESSLTLSKLKLLRWFFNRQYDNFSEIKSLLDLNLLNKNSLLDSDLSEFDLKGNKFDIIIGNPPYGNILTDKEKKQLKEHNIYFQDVYCAYLLKALELCNGVIGFLVPKSFLLRQSYVSFRNKLLSKSNLLRIYDLGSDIFKDATNEVQILIYSNKQKNQQDLVIYDYPDKENITFQNQYFDDLNVCFNSACPLNNKAKKFYVYTHKDNCSYCSNSTIPLNRVRVKVTKKIFNLINRIEKKGDLNYLNVKDYPKFIRGEEAKGLSIIKKVLKEKTQGSCFFIDAKRDFEYFYFKKSKNFDLDKVDEDLLKGEHKEYYQGSKLLIKHNNIYPEALYTKKDTCFTSSIYSLLHEDPNELMFLCGLLNSVLIQFYTIYGINNQKGTTINLNQYMIRHLPIINVQKDKREEISKIVELITFDLEENEKLNQRSINFVKKLNDRVFNLYSMNEGDQALMKAKVKLFNPYFDLIY